MLKRRITWVLSLVLLFAVGIAAYAEQEVYLTTQNCEELANVLKIKDPYHDSVKAFAKNFSGKLIAFDANIAYLSNHGSYSTRYDVLIHAGDYDETSVSGPEFQMRDVNLNDMGIKDLFLPEFMQAGSNVYIVAKVVEYKEMAGLLMLDPVLVKAR